jgi:serine/threonine protein kinase
MPAFREEDEEVAAAIATKAHKTRRKPSNVAKFFRWIRARTSKQYRKGNDVRGRNEGRRHSSTEMHANRWLRVESKPSTSDMKMLEDHKPKQLKAGSWAEITTPFNATHLLHPRADSYSMGLESGYTSRTSLSTPRSLRNFSTMLSPSNVACGGGGRDGAKGQNKSRSVDLAATSITTIGTWKSEDANTGGTRVCNEENILCGRSSEQAKEKRKKFRQRHQQPVTEEVSNEMYESRHSSGSGGSEAEDLGFVEIEGSLGEWFILPEELTFFNRVVDGGAFGHDVFQGRWHGDVVIHSIGSTSPTEVRSFLKQVRDLTQIRHENLVNYMGASVLEGSPVYNIVTNPVKAESLHARLTSMCSPKLDLTYMVSVAKQLANAIGYLHAKSIVHGRISTRNVFLENKVQLSLLDYAVGIPNTAYSSPQVLCKKKTGTEVVVYQGKTETDDIFAFGTLLLKLFSSPPQAEDENEEVIASRIRSGGLPKALSNLTSTTERLRRLIKRCWEWDPSRRPTFATMTSQFAPGCCLLRRQSTSEPSLDQIGIKSAKTLACTAVCGGVIGVVEGGGGRSS